MAYSFRLAQEEDGLALRELLARNPVPGSISLVYKREPSFFLSNGLMGKSSNVYVAEYKGKIIGLGISSLLDCYIHGNKQEIGYLHSLRIAEEHRGHYKLLTRGYELFREFDQKTSVPFYLTTIIEDNEYAIKILTSHRASIPVYHDIGRYTTYAINFRRKKMKTGNSYEIKKVETRKDLKRIIAFLNQEGRKKLFFPCYREEDLLEFVTFNYTDIYLAYKNDEIVGTLAKWDQTEIKQTVVHQYSRKWRMMKPLYNLAAYVAGHKRLPGVGEKFVYFFVSFVAVRDNSRQIFDSLLRHLYNDNLHQNYNYCIVGLHEKDQLAEVLKDFNSIKYNARMYLAGYKPIDKGIINSNSVPYLEAGRL